MSGFWLIMIGFVLYFLGSGKKTLRSLSSEPEVAPQPQPRTTYEDTDEEADPYVDFETSEECEDTFVNENTSFSKQTEGYFTYETMNDEPVQPQYKEVKPDVEEIVKEVVPNDTEINFDLRQAVIYQTILQNNYIGEN